MKQGLELKKDRKATVVKKAIEILPWTGRRKEGRRE